MKHLHSNHETCACGHVHNAQHNTCSLQGEPGAAPAMYAHDDDTGGIHASDTDDDPDPAESQSAPDNCTCAEADGCGCGHSHDTAGSAEWKKDGLRLGVAALFFLLGRLLPNAVSKTVFLAASYLVAGYPVILAAAKNLFSSKIFDETLLMTIASVGAAAIGEVAEASAVMLLFGIGELLQAIAVGNTKRSISALLALKPDIAHKLVDGALQTVDPADIIVGDSILVKPFERIPLDGVILDGDSFVDASALTGESVPVRKTVEDRVLAGSINGDAVLTVRVTATYAESAVSKIIRMTEQAAKQRAPRETFITRFARVYTPVVVGIAVLIALVPPFLLGLGTFREWLYNALTLLVISCPCALVISVPLAYFAGLGGSSRRGILAKGATSLEALAKVGTIAFDKTGTLTKGSFTVTQVVPASGIDRADLIVLCAHAEHLSTHPIGKSIVQYYGKPIDTARVTDITELRGKGIRATYDGQPVLVGKRTFLTENGIFVPDEGAGGSAVSVACNGSYIGTIVLGDTVKEDAARTIQQLKARGIQTVLLTGDTSGAAVPIAAQLDIDAVYADLLPADKVAHMQSLKASGSGAVAFVGDGINDAPVIAAADVGISMGGLGSDAAIEASDIVLMTDEPSKLLPAIDGSKRTLRIVSQNITLALGIKAAILLLSLFGLTSMWLAIVADVGASLLAILNAVRALRWPNAGAR